MNPYIFQAKVIASALRLYAKTKTKVNRAYTPTNMHAMVTKITGKTFKRSQYLEAADALDTWVREQQ